MGGEESAMRVIALSIGKDLGLYAMAFEICGVLDL
jgi:hypothetical protein